MKKILCIATMGVFVLGMLAGAAFSQPQAAKVREVQIISLEGTASIKRAGAADWVAAGVGDILGVGDALRTDSMSTLELNFDGSGRTAVVQVSENAELVFSKLSLDENTGSKETLLDLAIGSVLIKASKLEGESKFEVSTPTSIVGVRGTTFEVRVSAAE